MKRRSLLRALLLSLSLIASTSISAADKRVLHVWKSLDTKALRLSSKAALIADEFGNRLYEKEADKSQPIASLTKLMTAMVVLDSNLDREQKITINKDDRDLMRLTGSRLRYGAKLTRRELVILALMSSENRAAAALARAHPGGSKAFVRDMNIKAKQLHMYNSRFADPAGLDANNVASASDIVRMVRAAATYPLIRKATTLRYLDVRPLKKYGPLRYVNTNRLLRNKNWNILTSKTGYINEAGRCLVMMVDINGSEMVMVFLNSYGKLTPFGDANRTRKWLRKGVKKTRSKNTEPTLLSLKRASD